MNASRNVLIISKTKAQKQSSTQTLYFLSDDYEAFLALKRGHLGRVRTFGKPFHEAIAEIKGDFFELFDQIHELHGKSPLYWETHLASRNSAAIPLLKRLAFLECAKVVLNSQKDDVTFVVDSHALGSLVADHARSLGARVQTHAALTDHLAPIVLGLKWFAGAGYFLATHLLLALRAKRLSFAPLTGIAPGKRALFFSWVTKGAMNDNGEYQDRNFGVLPTHLESTGADVWTMPLFFNLERSLFDQMKLMSSRQFVFSENHLGIVDYFRVVRDAAIKACFRFHGLTFRGADVSALVREHHEATALSQRLLSLNAIKYVLRNLKKRGVTFERFFYPFENNAVEKTFILAVRQSFPRASIFGFQHSVWYKEQYGMCLSQKEQAYHPLPDAILTSGDKYLDVLEEAGLPAGKIKAGANLRYTSVNSTPVVENLTSDKRLLIILNFDENHVKQLLAKVGEALGLLAEVRDLEVVIKAHPTLNIGSLEKFLNDVGFPSYQWAEGSVQQCLQKARMVFMTAGSVSNLETMTMGVPIIRVSLDGDYDFDPLWEKYPLFEFAFSPEEIASQITTVLKLSQQDLVGLKEFALKVKSSYFEPVTMSRLERFEI